MDLNEKDIFLVFAGVVGSFIASALWSWWSVRSRKSRESLRAEEALWHARLNHEGYLVRSEAASEIIVRGLHWLVLGNVSLAASGLSWVLNLTSMRGIQPIIAEVIFVVSVVFFAIALKWLRRYLRLKVPLTDLDSSAADALPGSTQPSIPND